MNTIAVNTNERAATPAHELGVWFYRVSDERLAEHMAAFRTLGFNPWIVE